MRNWKEATRAARLFAGQFPRPAAKSYPAVAEEDAIIPKVLYSSTRDNVEEVCRQINLAFQYEVYDGAAVLIRKVIEMLLILTFKHYGLESLIRDSDGNYSDLSFIVKETVKNTIIDCSRNAKEYLELFREKGNLSAHNPFHISNRKDLELLQPKIRHLFQELLFKSGIRK